MKKKKNNHKKNHWNTARRKGEANYRGINKNYEEEPIVTVPLKSTFLHSIILLKYLIVALFSLKLQLEDVAIDARFDFKTTIFTFIFSTVIGATGVFIFYVSGGKYYFNLWYFIMHIVISLGVGILVMILCNFLMKFIWSKNRFFYRKQIYIIHVEIQRRNSSKSQNCIPRKIIFSSR